MKKGDKVIAVRSSSPINQGMTGVYLGKLPVGEGEPRYAVKWNRFNKGHACNGYYPSVRPLTGEDMCKGYWVCKEDIKKMG
jgi:hypothetical protein